MHLSRAAFEDLRRSIHRLCGLVVSDDKEYLIRDRLQPLIEDRGWTGFGELRDRLQRGSDPRLVEAVIDAMTTQETSFFRDPHVFDALAKDVLPSLATSAKKSRSPIRIWSAGVSTGQEAYSLAMLAHEFAPGWCDADGRCTDCSMLATDISLSALRAAQAGVYGQREIMRGLDTARRDRYFEKQGTQFRARQAIQRPIEFRRVNMIEPLAALGPFDLICCRNVLIYFDEPTRRRICQQLYSMLTAGGWLLLGAAENLYGTSRDFISVRLGEALVYRKS